MKKNNLYYITILFVVGLFVSGCSDFLSNPNNQGLPAGKTAAVTIYSPASNDSLGFGTHPVNYDISPVGSIDFVELYIDGKYIKNFFPKTASNIPPVTFTLDSSLVGKKISLYLIYYDLNGGSAASDTVKNITVTERRTPPAVPFELKLIRLTNNTVNISWKDTSETITSYEVWRKAGFDGDFKKYVEAPAGTFNINDEYLAPGQVYFYKIRSINEFGISAFSAIINTAGVGGSLNVYPPTDLTATTLSSSAVKLQWKDNSSNENYFTVERKTNYTGFTTLNIVARNVTEYTDSESGLVPGAQYAYRIKAFSSSDSSWSNTVYVTMPSSGSSAPFTIRVDRTPGGKILLNWNKAASKAGVIEISRKASTAKNYKILTNLSGNETRYLDNYAVPGSQYIYKLIVRNQQNKEIYRAEVSNK